MSREVRRVPADWVHPVYTYDSNPRRSGKPIPLWDFDYDQMAKDWDEAHAQWEAGFVESYEAGQPWKPKSEEHSGRYTEWAGPRPSPDDYMPKWPREICTHLMMYETTSEGTPISPAFETPEELAHWLADNSASSFGSSTATYEQWLCVCNDGWAPSAVMIGGQIFSGVEALSEKVQP